MDNLKIEYLPVEDLVPYQNNARKHTNTDVSAIAKSIEMFGFDDPIGIWKGNVIIEGHGRLMAAKQLGMETVPVIRLDHLTDEERRSYALVHNKSAELSEWDFDNLNLELESLDGRLTLNRLTCRLNLTMKWNKPNTPPLLTVVTMMIL